MPKLHRDGQDGCAWGDSAVEVEESSEHGGLRGDLPKTDMCDLGPHLLEPVHMFPGFPARFPDLTAPWVHLGSIVIKGSHKLSGLNHKNSLLLTTLQVS